MKAKPLPRSVSFAALGFFCVLALTPSLQAKPAATVPKVEQKPVKVSCTEGLESVRKAVLADPGRADLAMARILPLYAENCECVPELAKEGLRVLPKKDGVADSRMLASMVRAILTTIYKEVPCATGSVQDIILAALDCLGPDQKGQFLADGKTFDGKTFDPKGVPEPYAYDPLAVTQILAAAISVLAVYQPELIDPLLRTAAAEWPVAAPSIEQLRSLVLTSLPRPPLVGPNPPTVEPNLQPETKKKKKKKKPDEPPPVTFP